MEERAVYQIGKSYMSEAPHYGWLAGRQASRPATAATFAPQGGGKLPFIVGIEVRLASQLPGKPVAGAGGKHVGSY